MLHKGIMFRVEKDQTKNLLIVSYWGKVDVEEARLGHEKIREALDALKPGFCMLTDMTGLESMDDGSLNFIRKTMDLCTKHEIAKVVRVIPDPSKDIGLNILSLFHYRRNLPIVTCETLEEAMKLV
jgi:anti-anti-sigma regulatory factor